MVLNPRDFEPTRVHAETLPPTLQRRFQFNGAAQSGSGLREVVNREVARLAMRFDNFKSTGRLCTAVSGLGRPQNQRHRRMSVVKRQRETVLQLAKPSSQVFPA